MAKPQRFSGPELGELLDRVVSELGPSAEISAVNKVRSGGVAGFFCREEYEIVVGAHAKPRKSPPTVNEEPKREQTGEQTPATVSAANGVAATTNRPANDPADGPVNGPTNDPANGPANGAPTIAAPRAGARATVSEPADQVEQRPEEDRVATGPDGASEVFGGPRPRATNGTDARFMALLERRLTEASETETQLAARRARRPRPQPAATLPIDEPQSQELTPARPSAEFPFQASEASDGGAALLPPSSDVHEVRDFWARINKTRHELTTFMPTTASFVAVIGPLSLTTPVVRRLRTEQQVGAADVVVLTDRAEIVSEPTWQLVRSGHQLVDLAKGRADWPTILVIDVPVELPQWLAPLQQRLRLAGVGVFRYAVPGNPSAARLDNYRSVSDVPYVLDLVSRVEPERVVDLIAQRHPVGSVGGAALTPELLVAMREQVRGR